MKWLDLLAGQESSQSCLTLCDPLTVAYQAPPSMEFSRQEYWSGLPFPSLGDIPDPGIKPMSPILQADALLSEPPGKPSTPTPQFKSINSSALSFLYSPAPTSVHDYWQNHRFDSTDLCQQSDVSAF